MKDALVASASEASAPAGSSGFDYVCASLPYRITEDEAVVMVKEAVSGGLPFVVLANAHLPVLREVQ